MELTTFKPGYGTGSLNAVTDASSSVSIPENARSIALSNLGSSTVWVRVTDGASTATTSDYPVLASQQVSIAKGRPQGTLSMVCNTGDSSTLHVIVGEGF